MKMETWIFVENMLEWYPQRNKGAECSLIPWRSDSTWRLVMEWVLLLNLIHGVFFLILKICPETLFSSIKDRMLNYYLNQYYILVSDLRLFFSKLSSSNTICYPSANISTIMPLLKKHHMVVPLIPLSIQWTPHHRHHKVLIFKQSYNWLQIWFF